MPIVTILILLFLSFSPLKAEDLSFRFHIQADPVTLDPLRSNGSWNSFIHYNLYRSFFKFSGTTLENEYAKKCTFVSSTELHCQMKMDRRFSGGTTITLKNYMQPFFVAFDKNSTANAKAEVVHLKNAKAILAGAKPLKSLGVSAHPTLKDTIVFTFDQPDADFMKRLTSPVFSPRPIENTESEVLAKNYASGPYRFKSKESLKAVEMISNEHYRDGHATRPPVKALIVNNDSTAFNMYKTGVLNFLRRLPQDQYTAILKSEELEKELYIQPQLRMDHVGMAGILIDQPQLRAALTLSADYAELQKVLQARGRPGCFALLKEYYAGEHICYEFDLKKAKELLAQVPPDVLKKPIQFYYSIQGGDDIQRAVEWFQNQWKKNLGLSIHLNPSEQTELTSRLKTKTPDIYRRGVPVDSASCLSALETFQENHPENFLKIKNSALTKSLKQLNNPRLSQKQQKVYCRNALLAIFSETRLIPLGEMYFVSMSKPEFTGWKLNSLNQLDLSGLRVASK